MGTRDGDSFAAIEAAMGGFSASESTHPLNPRFKTFAAAERPSSNVCTCRALESKIFVAVKQNLDGQNRERACRPLHSAPVIYDHIIL